MNIEKLINKDTVFFIDKQNKTEVLRELTHKAHLLGSLTDEALFQQAIEEREALLSTGIGLGVAIPHAKIESVTHFFVVTGICKTPIAWDSLDHKPVSLVFLIGGPEEEQVRYLQILSQLMIAIKDDAKREAMLAAGTTEAFIARLMG